MASPGATVWGPDATPYRAGIVCTDTHGSTALASWPSAATGAPAFALAPVTAGPGDSHAAVPAVDAAAATPYAGAAGTVLAALLARHAEARTAATGAELAAAVLHASGTDPVVAPCLAARSSRTFGASVRGADALWSDATRLAGPYTVQLDVGTPKLVLGRPAEVVARVVSASGAGVPGVEVAFGTTGPGADLRRGSAVTDASGRAATTVTASTAAAVRAVGLVARASVPGTPVEISAPGEVSLVAAGASHVMTRRTRVPIDTTADPSLSLSVDRAVVLPGSTVHPALSVTGMRGHAGSARLSVAGPLPLSAASGCARYAGGVPASRVAATRTASASSARFLDVRGDGTVRAAPLMLAKAGCYVLSSDITTDNAMPNVHRVGGRQVVAVAPVQVSLDPAGGGVSAIGRLTADVRVTGRVPAELDELRAAVVGPVRSNDGSCAGVHFTGAGARPTVTAERRGSRLTSTSVRTPGCYAFRVQGTLQIPHLGSVPLAAPVTATTLVVAPSVSVSGLSTGDAAGGGAATATVTVSGTWTQRGAVRLQLLRLPYNWHGCFDRDWTRAEQVPLKDPATPTRGDGTYRVRTADIPGSGCWTVEPVLTLSRNPAITVRDASVDPMTAFTALPATAQPAARQVSLQTSSDGADRVVTAGAIMLGLLIVALGSTLRLALRDQAEIG